MCKSKSSVSGNIKISPIKPVSIANELERNKASYRNGGKTRNNTKKSADTH